MTAIEIDVLREQLLALIDGLDARMPFDALGTAPVSGAAGRRGLHARGWRR
jgi:hypothetical protein